MLAMMNPRYLLSMADDCPRAARPFLQFGLLIIYPAWLFMVAVWALTYGAIYAVLWVIFWPVRAWMKQNRPEEYAASQRK